MEDGGLRSLPFSLFFFFLISDESHVKNAVRAVKGIAFFFFFLTQQFLLYIFDVALSHKQSCKSISSLCDASG